MSEGADTVSHHCASGLAGDPCSRCGWIERRRRTCLRTYPVWRISSHQTPEGRTRTRPRRADRVHGACRGLLANQKGYPGLDRESEANNKGREGVMEHRNEQGAGRLTICAARTVRWTIWAAASAPVLAAVLLSGCGIEPPVQAASAAGEEEPIVTVRTLPPRSERRLALTERTSQARAEPEERPQRRRVRPRRHRGAGHTFARRSSPRREPLEQARKEREEQAASPRAADKTSEEQKSEGRAIDPDEPHLKPAPEPPDPVERQEPDQGVPQRRKPGARPGELSQPEKAPAMPDQGPRSPDQQQRSPDEMPPEPAGTSGPPPGT